MSLPLGLGSPTVGQSVPPTDPMAPSYWTGTWTLSNTEVAFETEGPGYTEYLILLDGNVVASDPRISGPRLQNHRPRTYHGPEGDVSLASATIRIDNEDRSRVGILTGYYSASGGEEWNQLEGDGAYEGLTAVFRFHADNR